VSGGWIFVTSFWSYMAMFVIFARREYRDRLKDHQEHYSRMYGQPLARVSRDKALGAAYSMIVKWPFRLFAMTLNWLITSPHLLGVPDSETDPWSAPETDDLDPTQELINRLDRELNPDQPGGVVVTKISGHDPNVIRRAMGMEQYNDLKHGPRNEPCPCGYTTECVIHCGNGHETGACPDRHTARLSTILQTPEFRDGS